MTEPSGVAEATSEIFHPTNRSGQSLEDNLIEILAPKQLLLVLDNCEHVLGPVARLVSRVERFLSRRGGAGHQPGRNGLSTVSS